MMLHRFDSLESLNKYLHGKNRSDFTLTIEMCPAKTYNGYTVNYFILDFADKQQNPNEVKQ